MSRTLDLSSGELALVRAILAEHLPANTIVWAFGSRVNGTARRYSDLDLALQCDAALDLRVLGGLADALSESDLPFSVDLVDLNNIDPEFRARITPDLTELPI